MTANTSEQNIENSNLKGFGGKYLTFALGEERYGIEILKVQEIIGVSAITKVPKSPPFLKGVINLRGKIIPIVDLRLKLGMAEKEYDDATCFIVVNALIKNKSIAIGIVVDTVQEVISFEEVDIQPVPDYGASLNTNYIIGMGKTQEDVVILIDINTTLEDTEAVLSAVAEETQD